MEVQIIIEWANELVLTQTGKNLDDLQVAILRGSCQRQKYSTIAADYHCSESHVKKMAYLLWKILSEASGEKICKGNVRATFTRVQGSHLLNPDNVLPITSADDRPNLESEGEPTDEQGDSQFCQFCDETDCSGGSPRHDHKPPRIIAENLPLIQAIAFKLYNRKKS